jgi:hypothetical protein
MLHGRVEDRPVGSGGRVSDVCLTTAEVSVERLRCRMDQFLAAPPCALPHRVTASIARAQRFAAQVGKRSPRRMLRRTVRALGKAERLAATQVALECRPGVQSGLEDLTSLASTLAASAPLH